jgi:hypothetical protein
MKKYRRMKWRGRRRWGTRRNEIMDKWGRAGRRKGDKTRRRRKRNTRLLPDPFRLRELQTQSL